MASIGLLDYDLTYWQQPVVFNLELMKLAAYYKQKRDIIQMLHEYDNSRYSKIIVRKDYEDDCYPPDIFNNPKSDCGGLVFSNGIYVPMDMEIERMVPDTTIYEKMGKYYQANVETRFRFGSLLSAPHLRLSLDGKTLWDDWQIPLEDRGRGKIVSFIVHDKNLVKVDGASQALIDTLATFNKNGRRVGFKYPLDIYDDDDFFEWGRILKLKGMSNMRLHRVFDDEMFFDINAISGGQSFEYILRNSDCTKETMLQIYKQAIFLRENYSRILLTYTEENMVSPELKMAMELINDYIEYTSQYRRLVTMYEYVRRYCKWLKVDLLTVFNYVKDTNYDLFKLFYECQAVDINDGKFESRWKWKANGGTIYDKR